MKIATIRFLGTETTTRVIVDARTIKAAEAILIEKLAAGTRSASFEIVGNAKKADRDALPTLDKALETPAPCALDSLAKLATALRMTPAEIAAELGGVSAATVQAWIDGTARPGEETRHALQIRVLNEKARAEKGRVALHRISTLQSLNVALQSPTERKLWLANRAKIRAQFAR